MFRAWLGSVTCQDGSELKSVLSNMREAARNLKEDFDAAVSAIATASQSSFGLSESQSRAFAALLIFSERFDHLRPWIANLREKTQRRRTHDYRTFAAQLLKDAQSVKIVVGDLRSRFLTEDQKAASLSDLVHAIENYATREGLACKTEKPLKDAIAFADGELQVAV